jgi:hypothetical protein
LSASDSWYSALQLYDEPQGDDYYIIDHSTDPPTWYLLDGTAVERARPVRPQIEVVRAAISRGWTPDKLYSRPPGHLVALFENFTRSVADGGEIHEAE